VFAVRRHSICTALASGLHGGGVVFAVRRHGQVVGVVLICAGKRTRG
jgi:hypothetical protein